MEQQDILNASLLASFIITVEGLQKELDEGNIDVYAFYEEMLALKEYIKNNFK